MRSYRHSLVFLISLFSLKAYGFGLKADIHSSYIQSEYDFESDGTGDEETKLDPQGMTEGATILVAPSMLPIGLGAEYMRSNSQDKIEGTKYKSSQSKLAAVLSFWVPLAIVEPYLSIKYLVMGDETMDLVYEGRKVASAEGKLSGYGAELGLRNNFLPNLYGFLSLSHNQEVNKFEKITIESFTEDVTDGSQYKIVSNRVTLGVGFSL